MAQSVLKFDPGRQQEALGEQRSGGENVGCIRLAIMLVQVNRLLDREVGFIVIIILFYFLFSFRAFQRAPLAGRPDFFGAGGCLSTWHGVGGFTTNSPSSHPVVFFYCGISPFKKLRSPG